MAEITYTPPHVGALRQTDMLIDKTCKRMPEKRELERLQEEIVRLQAQNALLALQLETAWRELEVRREMEQEEEEIRS